MRAWILVLASCGGAAPSAAPPRPADPGPLALSHDTVVARMGGHRFESRARLRTFDGATPSEDLELRVNLQVDARGQYRLVEDNSQGLGKEVVWAGGTLYSRHRYGAFLRRDDGEAAARRMREEAWGALGAYLETCAHGLDFADEGGALRVARAARARPAAAQAAPERKWRETVEVDAAEGRVTLAQGVPVEAALKLAYRFRKAGRRPRVALEYTHRLVRDAPIVRVPDAAPTPVRRRYEEERKRLLGGT